MPLQGVALSSSSKYGNHLGKPFHIQIPPPPPPQDSDSLDVGRGPDFHC